MRPLSREKGSSIWSNALSALLRWAEKTNSDGPGAHLPLGCGSWAVSWPSRSEGPQKNREVLATGLQRPLPGPRQFPSYIATKMSLPAHPIIMSNIDRVQPSRGMLASVHTDHLPDLKCGLLRHQRTVDTLLLLYLLVFPYLYLHDTVGFPVPLRRQWAQLIDLTYMCLCAQYTYSMYSMYGMLIFMCN